MLKGIESFLANRPQFRDPESPMFDEGLRRVRKFFPRTRITDYLFRRVRYSKLKKNIVYLMFKEDDYLKDHYDLCEKILRYVNDWISGTRQPYGTYTLPPRKKLMIYFSQVKKVLEAYVPEESEIFPNMQDFCDMNQIAKQTGNPRITHALMSFLYRRNCPKEAFARLGDNIFEHIPELVDRFGHSEIIYLMQLTMYVGLCEAVGFVDKKKLLREGISPNPGPVCKGCDRDYEFLEIHLCPICAPDLYLQRRDNSKNKQIDHKVLIESQKFDLTCRQCAGRFLQKYSLVDRVSVSRDLFYLRFLLSLQCPLCFAIEPIVFPTTKPEIDMPVYLKMMTVLLGVEFRSDNEHPARLYRRALYRNMIVRATERQLDVIHKLPVVVVTFLSEVMYANKDILIRIAHMTFMISTSGVLYHLRTVHEGNQITFSMNEHHYEEVEDMFSYFILYHPTRKHPVYLYLKIIFDFLNHQDDARMVQEIHTLIAHFMTPDRKFLPETFTFINLSGENSQLKYVKCVSSE